VKQKGECQKPKQGMRETTENKNRVIAFFRLKKRLSKQRN
jgi:hypothetical protein